ncbi:hypothetical protein K2Z84_11475 [Candidatus Binatia bacterium]|nr:hypothetical protein [Candidatus Binatia bacterium]
MSRALVCLLALVVAMLAAERCHAEDAAAPRGVIYPTLQAIGDGFLGGANAVDQALQTTLPLGRALAGDREGELALPVGLTFGYNHQWQRIRVERLDVTLDGSPPIAVPSGAVDDIRVSTSTYALTLDAWLLPFWNVFGVGAYSEGTADIRVDVPPIVSGSFEQPYRVVTAGGGTTLAGGWRELFAIGSVNWTTQDVNVLESRVNVFIAAPRIGWQTSVGPTALSLWTGANYLHLSQHQYGQISFDIPGRGSTDVGFDLDIREVGAWNAALGGRVSLGKRFDLVLDGGVGVRRSILAALTFRF